MIAIKGKDTLPERILRKRLWKRGIRFRKNVKGILGKPDIVIRKHKLIIFVDSCFWHACPFHFKRPKSKSTYWKTKFTRNRNRDIFVTRALRRNGWIVLRFWEHAINSQPEQCLDKIIKKIQSKKAT